MTIQVQSDTRLTGRRLTVARAAWLTFFALATITLLVAFPARWAELTHPGPNTLANLIALGWPVSFYAVSSLAVEVVFAAAYLLVGLLIFIRRSDDRMALFMALTLVAFGVGNQTIALTLPALRQYSWGEVVYDFGGFAAWVTFTQFPYLFPSGRYVPGWSRIPALVFFLLVIPWNFMEGMPFFPPAWPPVIFGPLTVFLWGSITFSQIYRYRRVSTPIERQQTKWVMYALAMIVVGLILLVLGTFFYGGNLVTVHSIEETSTPELFIFGLVAQFGAPLVFLWLPIAFAFSILRYRLWDIDILIRRTLQYSVFTGLLALTYFGSVVVLQGVFTAVTGQQPAVVVVISTLAIAALFFPLRNRVQAFIDKRFYRKKYDAAKVIAEFAATCRDETDLDKLTARLVEVVDETMQPESVSLWLKPTGDGRRRRS